MNPATQAAMTALIRNGGYGGGKMADTYFARNCSLPWANQFSTASGALPLVPVGARGSRRRIEEATTNEIINPVAGTDLTGIVTGGTNTIERITDFAAEGLPPLPDGLAGKVTTCIKATYADSNTLVQWAATTLTAAAYQFSMYILLPTGFDGTAPTISDGDSFAGATGTQSAAIDTGINNSWQRPDFDLTPVAGDLVGNFQINGGTPTAGRVVYAVFAQIEQKAYATSACAGSLGTGYAWTGAAHASTSTRAVSNLVASPAIFNSASYGGAFWLRPGWGDGSEPGSFPTVFDARTDADNRVSFYKSAGSNIWRLEHRAAAASDVADLAELGHVAGDDLLLVINGNGAVIGLSVNGGTLSEAPSTKTPAVTAVSFGGIAGGSLINSIYGPGIILNRPFMQSEIIELYAKGPAAMNLGSILA